MDTRVLYVVAVLIAALVVAIITTAAKQKSWMLIQRKI
jgi:archaellum component FlaG (FlaF/FlaG flagellin family)